MKTVTIKKNKVIAVWKNELAHEYKDQYTDFDEQIEVSEDTNVMTGMIKSGKKRITFKRYIDPQVEIDRKVQELSKAKEREIIEKLGATDKMDAIVKQINAIAKNLVDNELADKQVTQAYNLVIKILNK